MSGEEFGPTTYRRNEAGELGVIDAQGNWRSLEPELIEGSEDAMADDFVGLYRHLFRVTPGLGWMRCGANGWHRDETLTHFDCARQIARMAAQEAEKPAAQRATASAKTVSGLITLARTDPRITLEASAWDADRHLLNTPAGLVDLRTGSLRMRDIDDYVTRLTRVSPDFKAACPTWLRFLAEVFPDDVDTVAFMQRLIGYALTGDRHEQKIFFMFGRGSNGKSTLWDFVTWLAGSYTLKLPAHVLMHSQLQAHPTELAQLRGTRLAISSEIEEGQYWAESRIKELTGDEMLTARLMRQDFFEFPMTQKHIIIGNYKPRLRGGDAALARRFVLVPFRAKFEGKKRDPRMLDRLRDEGPAVLAWAIQGAVQWHREGLGIPAAVATASREYMIENDDLQVWIDEMCVIHPAAATRAMELYHSFLGWLKTRGQHAPSLRLWADRMSAVQGVGKRKSHGAVIYQGIGIRAVNEPGYKPSE
ncbi:MAG: hypothetical protein JSR59_21895 [Proteobacteria bacterium]|nr:hypothetical protein [Pseudomonadota bacterium]